MAKDWTHLYKKYKGLWVALKNDEVTVVGYGKTVREAIDKALAKGHKNPIMTKIPQELSAFVG